VSNFFKLKKKNIEYYIDGFKVKLNGGHNLPSFQKRFPMYDQFVPYLGQLANVHHLNGLGGGYRIYY